MFADKQYRYYAAVDRTLPPGRLMNVLAHGANALSRKLLLDADPGPQFVRYIDREGGLRGEFPVWAYIVLEAKSGTQLANLRAKVLAAGLPTVDIIAPMIGDSTESQLRATAECACDTEQVYGVFFFGPAEVATPLVKRFSCFQLFREAPVAIPILPPPEVAPGC
jgi:hypothetical protein